VAPRTPTECRLAAIWSDVLGIEHIGVHDGFFSDLGGHSLLAIRMSSRVRAELDYELALREIFEQPTVAGIAALIDARRATDTVAESRPLLRRRVEATPTDVDGMSDEDVQRLLAGLLAGESAR
jgi:acyl carrier protein